MILTTTEQEAICWRLVNECMCGGEAGCAVARAVERAVLERLAEPLINACVPGGGICDPQQVADAIRAWVRERGA